MTTRARTVLLTAALAAGALLATAGCDADCDGLDDNTGEPVSYTPGHCQDDRGAGGDADFGPAPGVPQSWMEMAAEHEAGHKAVADSYGWTVLDVQVEPDGSGETTVLFLRLKDPEKQLVFFHAGAVAAGSEDGSGGDFEQIDSLLGRFPAGQRDRVWAETYGEATRIVDARSERIGADAAVLLEDGELG